MARTQTHWWQLEFPVNSRVPWLRDKHTTRYLPLNPIEHHLAQTVSNRWRHEYPWRPNWKYLIDIAWLLSHLQHKRVHSWCKSYLNHIFCLWMFFCSRRSRIEQGYSFRLVVVSVLCWAVRSRMEEKSSLLDLYMLGPCGVFVRWILKLQTYAGRGGEQTDGEIFSVQGNVSHPGSQLELLGSFFF